MARALALAEEGLYTTCPNPRVGCVLAHGERIVGEGWHRRAGEPHAEIFALRDAGEKARDATAYVTLEPCAHHGRTPPCADALIEAGVARVVTAMRDPNPLVAGKGLKRLEEANISVETGLMENEARELNIGFVSRMTRGRPWTRVKAAASLDGKTALANGISKWITGEEARRDGHRWRARACAILTGLGTVVSDDPELSVRAIACERQPLRIVVDTRLKIPLQARILATDKILVATACEDHRKIDALEAMGHEVLLLPASDTGVDLSKMLSELGIRGINELHVEAGARLNGALLHAACVDELILYLAPQLLGGSARNLFELAPLTSLDQAIKLHILEQRPLGNDLRIQARVICSVT